jgi:hypothetical protein
MATKFLAKRNFFIVELKSVLLAWFFNLVGEEGLPDLQNLLGDHRQHLNLNTVEFVETGPGTSLSQA